MLPCIEVADITSQSSHAVEEVAEVEEDKTLPRRLCLILFLPLLALLTDVGLQRAQIIVKFPLLVTYLYLFWAYQDFLDVADMTTVNHRLGGLRGYVYTRNPASIGGEKARSGALNSPDYRVFGVCSRASPARPLARLRTTADALLHSLALPRTL